MAEFVYLSLDDVLSYYNETIEQSGGGMSGIREREEIEKILFFCPKRCILSFIGRETDIYGICILHWSLFCRWK